MLQELFKSSGVWGSEVSSLTSARGITSSHHRLTQAGR